MNSPRTSRKRSRVLPVLTLLSLAALTALAFYWAKELGIGRAKAIEIRPNQLVEVRRAPLDLTVSVGGELDSAKKTLIECELEQLGVRSRGSSLNSSGYSTILTLRNEGEMVKKGDVLCTLDGSEYEELLRQAKIYTDRARADKISAEFDLSVAEIAKEEYLKGKSRENFEKISSQLALAESDIVRFRDRLAWTQQMKERGYVSQAQVTADQLSLQRSFLELQRLQGSYRLFRDFTIPKMTTQLNSRILTEKKNLDYYTQRLKMAEDRVKTLEKQIEFCTIKAPHDGRLVYAKDRSGSRPIQLGVSVYHKMDLFILPDLGQLQVLAKVNESMISKVQLGQRATVQLETDTDKRLTGTVIDIEQFPVMDENRSMGITVNNYYVKIDLDGVHNDLLPGVTAKVEIQTGTQSNCLLVPPTSLFTEDGIDMCCVVDENDEPVFRPVQIGHSNSDWVEIIEGLDEGESVVFDSSLVDDEEIAIDRDHADTVKTHVTTTEPPTYPVVTTESQAGG